VLFYSFPAFAAAFSFLLFRENISRFETVCVLAAIAGVAVIFDIKIEGSILGQVFALLAGVIAGLTISIIKKLRETNGSVVIFMFFCIMGTGVSLPHMFTSPGIPSSPLDAAILAGIAVTSIFGQLLMNQGFHYCKSWEGGAFPDERSAVHGTFRCLLYGRAPYNSLHIRRCLDPCQCYCLEPARCTPHILSGAATGKWGIKRC